MEDVKDKYHASDVKDDQTFFAATAVLRVGLRKRQKRRASEMRRMAAAEDDTTAIEEGTVSRLHISSYRIVPLEL